MQNYPTPINADAVTLAFMCDTYRQSKFSTIENYSLLNIMHEVLTTVRKVDPMTNAAPDMLEALKDIDQWALTYPALSQRALVATLPKIRAAIAKAEGK